MANENGQWIMYGLEWDDPYRIRTYRELIDWINEIGFLPLFKNEIEGFSVEEHVSPDYWWTGVKDQDPWEWREIIAGTGEVAYGKFFAKKSGFVSLEWFPYFANYRRDGYDFDARWEDGLASMREKKIMDSFEPDDEEIKEYAGYQLKKMNNFGKGGYKNFDGVITELQMKTYLTIKDFRKKKSKKGEEYGMPVSIYVRPEDFWGYDIVSKGYTEDPKKSKERIFDHIKSMYPDASDKDIEKVMK